MMLFKILMVVTFCFELGTFIAGCIQASIGNFETAAYLIVISIWFKIEANRQWDDVKDFKENKEVSKPETQKEWTDCPIR